MTDQTGNEINHGADPNGVLPPPPPEIIFFSANMYIGGTSTITGNNFSGMDDALICFESGPCVHPDSATETEMTFTVPAGATTGLVSVSIGFLESEPMSVDIGLEDPSLPSLTFRTLGFAYRTDGGTLSHPVGDYYSVALESGTFKVYQHSYNNTTGKWQRTQRNTDTDSYFCSTKTDAAKNLYCADATLHAGFATGKKIATDPAANMSPCITFNSSNMPAPNDHCRTGENCRLLGAAPDPNPESLPGRDVIYFMFENASRGIRFIKKVSTDCSTILDQDFGNRKGTWNWGGIAQPQASVDPATGDLYVSEKTFVTRITTSENVSTFKTGFSNLYSLDIWHEPGTTFGIFMGADSSASTVRTLPLDNPGSAMTSLATGVSTRAVTAASVSAIMGKHRNLDSSRSNSTKLPADDIEESNLGTRKT